MDSSPASIVKSSHISCSFATRFSWIQTEFNSVASNTKTSITGRCLLFIPPVHKICFRVEFPFRQDPSVICRWGIPLDLLLWFLWVRWRLLLRLWEAGALLNALCLIQLISLFPTPWHTHRVHEWKYANTNEWMQVPASTHTNPQTHTFMHTSFVDPCKSILLMSQPQ